MLMGMFMAEMKRGEGRQREREREDPWLGKKGWRRRVRSKS